MYCINRVPTIKPGDDKGVAFTAGGKMKGKLGPTKGKVIFPFVKAVAPDYKELAKAYDKLCEVYDEYGKKKERIGDMRNHIPKAIIGLGILASLAFERARAEGPAPIVAFPESNSNRTAAWRSLSPLLPSSSESTEKATTYSESISTQVTKLTSCLRRKKNSQRIR